MDGTTAATGGGTANLRPPSSTEEARELGRLGGIASGIARRRRISIREELSALLSAGDGIVARNIVAAICHEAKRGNVGAFKAIAQVMGELKEVVEMPDLPPPFVIELHDPASVEAERKRQAAAMAETIEAVAASLPTTAAAALPGHAEDAADGTDGAEPAETGCGAAENAPGASDAESCLCEPKAPEDRCDAPSANAEPEARERPPELRPEPRSLRPSEVAAMKRAKAAQRQGAQQQRQAGRPFAVPVAFPRR